jgi:hypothetical protein
LRIGVEGSVKIEPKIFKILESRSQNSEFLMRMNQ